MSESMLTFDEALSRLGVDADALNRLVSDGELRAVVQNREMAFRASEIERYLAGGVSEQPLVHGAVASAASSAEESAFELGDMDISLDIDDDSFGVEAPVEPSEPAAVMNAASGEGAHEVAEEGGDFAPPPVGDFGEDLSLDMDFSEDLELSEPTPITSEVAMPSKNEASDANEPEEDMTFSEDEIDGISLDADAEELTDATIDLTAKTVDTPAMEAESIEINDFDDAMDIDLDMDLDDTGPTEVLEEKEVGLETEEIVFDDDDLAIGGIDEDTSIGTQDMTVQEDAIELDDDDAGLTLVNEDAIDVTQLVDDGDLTVAIDDDDLAVDDSFKKSSKKGQKGQKGGASRGSIRGKADDGSSGSSGRRARRGAVNRPEPVTGLFWSLLVTAAALVAVVPVTIFITTSMKGYTTGENAFLASDYNSQKLPEYGASFLPYHLSRLIEMTDASNVFGNFSDVHQQIDNNKMPISDLDRLRQKEAGPEMTQPDTAGEDTPDVAGDAGVTGDTGGSAAGTGDVPAEASAESMTHEDIPEGAPSEEISADDSIPVAE